MDQPAAPFQLGHRRRPRSWPGPPMPIRLLADAQMVEDAAPAMAWCMPVALSGQLQILIVDAQVMQVIVVEDAAPAMAWCMRNRRRWRAAVRRHRPGPPAGAGPARRLRASRAGGRALGGNNYGPPGLAPAPRVPRSGARS